MADFRRIFRASGIWVLFACFTIPASAAVFGCNDNTATNQIARVEGWSEQVGDILLGCIGGIPTLTGNQVLTADITVTFPQTRITSRIINTTDPNTSGTPLSEATLIVDDIKDPSIGLATNFPGVRPHRVCSDSTPAGGVGVCNVISDGNPIDTYDGTAHRPNIFVARPSGTNAVVFNGVPLDPPGDTFERTLRITNLRVDATVFDPTNPFASVIAIISFQGPAAVGLNSSQTQVAFVQKGIRSTTVTADSSFLQCEYPTATLANADTSVPLAETHGWTSACGTPASCAGLTTSQITVDTTSSFAGSHPVIQIMEGYQTAWKPRNMSELLGTNGEVLGIDANCAGGPGLFGNPCVGTSGDNNSLSSGNIFAYNTTLPHFNPPDIAQNNPATRYFTEGGFSETAATVSYTTSTSTSFSYTAGAAGVGAGTADYGTRIQFTVSNQPNGAVVSLPTVVVLHNGGIASGVMVMTSVTGTGKGAYNPVAAVSGLPSLAAVQMQVAAFPTLTLTTGYVDLTGPSQTVTYEVLFSDPFSTETATIYPIVYYPPASLPSSLLGNHPQPDTWAMVTPATFAPYYAATGDQSTTPLGQADGTPRFTQTTGAASGLFTIAPCMPSISSVVPNNAVQLGPDTPVTIMGSGFTGGSKASFTPPGGAPTLITPSQIQLLQLAATIPAALLTTAGTAQIAVQNDPVTVSNSLSFTIKALQTISFAALTNRPLGSPPFTVSATASSGLPVSFSSLTLPVCTLSGSTVMLVAAGTCTIQAIQGGNATFAAAMPVNRSFQVTSVPQLLVTRSLSRDAVTHEVVVLVTITNNGTAGATNVRLTVAKIASTVTTTALPQLLGTIAAGGAFAQDTVRFPGSVGSAGAMTTLTLGGTYTGGSFGTTARVTLP